MEENKPNIILITIDCLRADHMSCYGYHRKTTPFIDKLAKEGILFPNMFVNGSFTALSVPSFLKSKLPFLWEGGVSIAELLKRNGYHTVAFNPNPLLIKMKQLGVRKGFEKYEIFLKADSTDKLRFLKEIFVEMFPRKSITYRLLSYLITYFSFVGIKPCARANEINREFFAWLEKNKQPFFAWLHYMDVHHPTLPFDEYIRAIGAKRIFNKEKAKINRKILHFPEKLNKEELQKRIDLYDASIRFVDDMVKELVENLQKENIYQDTILIITSDHGEEFGEHGNFLHDEGHLYDEIMHVPFIIANYREKSVDTGKLSSLIDMAPTIAQIAGINKKDIFDGKSLLENNTKNDYIIALGCRHRREYIEKGFENVPKIIACRTKKYKLIFDERKGIIEFYELSSDPQEKINIYKKMQNTDIFRWMKSKIISYRREIKRRQVIKNLTKKIINN